MLTALSTSATRPRACASLQTCAVLHVVRLRGCLPAEATLVRLRRYTGWVLSQVDCERVKERHVYSRDNFKLNRAAALAEWRQLLSA